MRLKDKVALITGASRGIGKAIGLTFAKEGADVIVNYVKNKEKARETVDEVGKIGRRAIAIQADIADKAEVFSMVNKAIKEFCRIDILVNNAGVIWRTSNVLEADKAEWERIFGVNVIGTYQCIQAAAPHMIKQRSGSIINISTHGSRTIDPA
ncbi:MAG: SDR family NAD(P)-dependent oxidoreductase, partial [Candidatus Hodarchaeota archaeon]